MKKSHSKYNFNADTVSIADQKNPLSSDPLHVISLKTITFYFVQEKTIGQCILTITFFATINCVYLCFAEL